MRALFTACGNVVRDFAYGIDAAHAIKHGSTPASQPARLVVRPRPVAATIRPRVRPAVGGRLEVAR